ncbi:MAG: hypothetical protein JNK82_08760 [Myxococcaceae bacterium]|nr:hypothetical protein [Myxococcaceae bacterium]
MKPVGRREVVAPPRAAEVVDPKKVSTGSSPPAARADGYAGSGAPISKLGGKTADGLKQVVTLAEAKALFDTLASAPDIPHKFIDEGCHFRAHVEAKRLEEAGVYSEKIFILPEASDLKILSPEHPLGFTLGIFHTAPCINVQLEDGRVERRVIDPSLFKGPVPEETWARSMHGLNQKPCEIFYLPRFALHLSDRKAPPSAWRKEDLADATAWNTQYQEVQKDMVASGFYDHLQELVKEFEVVP